MKPTVQVTDHALIRWLERVHGQKMEEYREMCAEEVQHLAEVGATGGYVDGHYYVLDGYKLIIVLDEKPSRERRRLGFEERARRRTA